MRLLICGGLLGLSLMAACDRRESRSEDDFVNRDGAFFPKFSDQPYTGDIYAIDQKGVQHPMGSMVNGVPEGAWTAWRENGTMFAQGSFVAGRRDGTWIEWGVGGNIYSKGSYTSGLKTGDWVFFPGSAWEQRGPYQNGLRHGAWHLEATLRPRDGYCREGREDGEWRISDWKTGQVLEVRTYKLGVLIDPIIPADKDYIRGSCDDEKSVSEAEREEAEMKK